MQVFGRSSHIIRNSRVTSRLLAAKCQEITINSTGCRPWPKPSPTASTTTGGMVLLPAKRPPRIFKLSASATQSCLICAEPGLPL